MPPELPTGQKSNIPTGLGRIGDIEFWAPNRGLLITAGQLRRSSPASGTTTAPAGARSPACAVPPTDASRGPGPEEFWTVSDGRTGQSTSEGTPPLADNTLCHFAPASEGEQRPLEVVGSYASLAFLPSSYQAMDGAACLSSEDCWFAGGPLPDEQHGVLPPALERPPDGKPNPAPRATPCSSISALRPVPLRGRADRTRRPRQRRRTPTEPSVIHAIEPDRGAADVRLAVPDATSRSANKRLPIYSTRASRREALDGPAAGERRRRPVGGPQPRSRKPANRPPARSRSCARTSRKNGPSCSGPSTDPLEGNPFNNPERSELAPASSSRRSPPSRRAPPKREKAREHALLALASPFEQQNERSALAASRRSAPDGAVVERARRLPEGAQLKELGPLGYASDVVCPAAEDCWLATSAGLPVPSRHRRRPRAPPKTTHRPGPRRQDPIASRPKTKASPRRSRTRSRKTTPGCPPNGPRRCPKPRKPRNRKKASSSAADLAGIKTKIAQRLGARTELPPVGQGPRPADREAQEAGRRRDQAAHLRAPGAASCCCSSTVSAGRPN